MNQYTEGYETCWKCHRRTKVFTWLGFSLWTKEKPPEPIPPTVKLTYSATIDDSYWANNCEWCGVIQGDFFLYHVPGHAFYGLLGDFDGFTDDFFEGR